MPIRIIITGGGTGGHLFPGIAVAQEFLTHQGAEVVFLTTPKAVTVQILEGHGIAWEAVASRAVHGQGLFSRIRTLLGLPGTVLKARAQLQRLNPDLVLGMGGYASFPVGLAARLLGIPLAIHEQNAVPGAANHWLSRYAAKIFTSFPDPRGLFPRTRTTWTGNPIRQAFFQPPPARLEPPFTVMLMGGSQGAHHLNMAALEALPLLRGRREELQFLHLAGEADEFQVASGYRDAGFSAEVAAFTPEVAGLMGRAHLLACRAGASTLAELAAVGRASILVPYPFAANNHQEFNARFFEDAGAAQVVLNKDFTGEVLAGKIQEFLTAPEALARMEAAARSLAKPHAAREIVAGCWELIGANK